MIIGWIARYAVGKWQVAGNTGHMCWRGLLRKYIVYYLREFSRKDALFLGI